MKSRVIFLDYDGVVNTFMWNEQGREASYNYPMDNKVNNFQAVQWLSEFCLKYEFDIVVTSSWRIEENYKDCLINGGLRKGIEILGRTKSIEGKTRGDEINDYLSEHPEVEDYIILDDINDFLPEQQNHFIRTNHYYGFQNPEYRECVYRFLKKKTLREPHL